MSVIELSAGQIELLADLVAARVVERMSPLGDTATPAQAAKTATVTVLPARRLVSAQTVADALNVDRTWVYANALALGGQRLGTGSRGRWRFNPDTAIANHTATNQEPHKPTTTRQRAPHRRRHTNPTTNALVARGNPQGRILPGDQHP